MDLIPPVILFIGPSGSGKTIVVEKVIARLRREEIKVGAIKRSHHDVELDTIGKDSWRFKESGANPVLLAGDEMLGFIERPFGVITLSSTLKFFTNKADIVIVEGFKSEPLNDFESFRFLFGPPFGKAEDKTGYIITTGDPDQAPGKIVFRREQVDSIAMWIMRWLAAR
ncbi:MAG: molybdopterin-guanine dinucleotide biosynthesis protein B [Nitrospinota bacterium]|nr:molybdopterin-guanine dinucleotide biosynthesis protein B [Nitrospinota bacterium]MDH5757673.1 molybdopterin-guanine dinucleotide biosynthesis protein B [Nitrospinota bacterium]